MESAGSSRKRVGKYIFFIFKYLIRFFFLNEWRRGAGVQKSI